MAWSLRSPSAPWNREPVTKRALKGLSRIWPRSVSALLFILFILTLWTVDLEAQAPAGVPPVLPNFHLTDVSVIVGLFALISGCVNKYMLRSIKAELNGFKLQLFAELDLRYVGVAAHLAHIASDQREHEVMRRDMDRLEKMIANSSEQTRLRVI